MNTKRLFKEDVYQRQAIAIVTAIKKLNNKTLITFNQTIFAPIGGGQGCDLGRANDLEIINVYEEDNEIFHEVTGDTTGIEIGSELTLSLNWEIRFDNMQRHCGEHILSGVLYKQFGGINNGFHMGKQYMTIDISLDQSPEVDSISWDMAKKAELCANEIIWNDESVIVKHFDQKEEAKKLPLRKELVFNEDISIVCIGNPSNLSDCVACCGTHPSTTGQVGIIKIYKIEPNKGMFRIYFEAGKRAFKHYQENFDILTELSNKLSAGEDDILSKYKAQQDKNAAARSQLYTINKYLIAEETKALALEITNIISDKPMVKYYEILSAGDLLSIGRQLSPHIPKLLFLVHSPSNTILLFSNGKIHCGNLVKENAHIYGGKGGGNDISARVIFNKKEYIDTFIDLIDKHLR